MMNPPTSADTQRPLDALTMLLRRALRDFVNEVLFSPAHLDGARFREKVLAPLTPGERVHVRAQMLIQAQAFNALSPGWTHRPRDAGLEVVGTLHGHRVTIEVLGSSARVSIQIA